MTADVDITVELGSHSVKTLLETLTRVGFEPLFELDDTFIAATRVLPVIHRTSDIPVDVILAGFGLDGMFMDAAEIAVIDDVQVPIIRAEHLVVMKIVAGRSHDIDDVEGIVLTKGNALNHDEIEQLLKLLESALDQSDLLPRWRSIAKKRRPRRL